MAAEIQAAATLEAVTPAAAILAVVTQEAGTQEAPSGSTAAMSIWAARGWPQTAAVIAIRRSAYLPSRSMARQMAK